MLIIHGMTVAQEESQDHIIAWPKAMFDLNYEDEWLDDLFVRRFITDIDKIDVLDNSHPTRRLLALNGEITPELLATGTKNLILCKFISGYWNRLGHMGENCYKWLMDIAEEKDVHMVTTRVFHFTDSDIKGRKIYFADINQYITSEYAWSSAILELSYAGLLDPIIC